jgi:acetolactate synthase-1/2/3 large subunit
MGERVTRTDETDPGQLDPGDTVTGHGGELGLAALRRFAVDTIFTLSGGHIFPFYDAAVRNGQVRLLDVRHEQTATFGAEAYAKLTRRVGVAALTAGPGITNGISATTTAHFNGVPLLILGGRAPDYSWGSGSLQEFDHVPVMASITKAASTVHETDAIGAAVYDAAELATTPHRGPVFVDFPLDALFGSGTSVIPDRPLPRGQVPDSDAVRRIAELVANAERPAIIAGSDVWLDGAHEALVAAVEHLRVPTFVNGQGRGCLPADHELAFSRTRRLLRDESDLVVVIGTPLDFRLGFGKFGAAEVVHITDHPDRVTTQVPVVAGVGGDLTLVLRALADHTGPRRDHEDWILRLRDRENAAAAAEMAYLTADSDPIRPGRIYGELRQVLDRDAVVVCDGGDFVSYAGKYLDSYLPGRWLDPGPYGCLGTAMGYAAAARLVHRDAQVVVMLGDGAAGFSLMDVDTLVRHGLPVVMVVGNNGIWALEKFPMQKLYGYHVAAELTPATRYDEVVRALGGAGETVRRTQDIGPALRRAFASGVPYLVNVLTDPDDEYPRASALS